MNPAIEPFLKDIYQRLYSGHAAVMVGAGFSKNALGSPPAWKAFPDWSSLGDTFYEKVNGTPPDASSRYLNPLKLAHEVEAAFGRSTLDNILLKYIPDERYKPSDLHINLLKLPWVDVFTTNYDTLLERSRSGVTSRKYDLVLTESDLIYSTKPRIVKLHGSFPSNKPFIISEEDYRQYPKKFSIFVNSVQQCLIENTLCLIGFSGDDPNFLSWIGWIRDNLGIYNQPKIYLVGTFSFSESQKKLLEKINVIPLEMSTYVDVPKGDHSAALNKFISILSLESKKDENYNWPEIVNSFGELSCQEIIDCLVKVRSDYPKWLICPREKRTKLRAVINNLSNVISKISFKSVSENIKLSYEINWVFHTCLLPIHGEFRKHLISLFDNENIVLDDVEVWGGLAVSLLITYRQEGKLDEWGDLYLRIEKLINMVSVDSRIKISLLYEKINLKKISCSKVELFELMSLWPEDKSLYEWDIKKAMLYAEFGEREISKVYINKILMSIRDELNLKPIESDYELISLESYAMFLETVLDEAGEFHEVNLKSRGSVRRTNRERSNQLDLYECSPEKEFDYYKNNMNDATVSKSVKYKFDLETYTTIVSFGDNTSLINAHSFVGFCEKLSLPYKLVTDLTSKAAKLLFNVETSLALDCLVNSGITKYLDEIISRSSFSKLDLQDVEHIFSIYCPSLYKLNESIKENGFDINNSRNDKRKVEVILDILSRFIFRIRVGELDFLLNFIFEIYEECNTSFYTSFKYLSKRFFTIIDPRLIESSFNRLINLPFVNDVKLDYIDPWYFMLKIDLKFLNNERCISLVSQDVKAKCLECLSSEFKSIRQQAQARLHVIDKMNILNDSEKKILISKLWADTPANEFPQDTIFSIKALTEKYPRNIEKQSFIIKELIFNRFSKSTAVNDLAEIIFLLGNDLKFSLISLSEDEFLRLALILKEGWNSLILENDSQQSSRNYLSELMSEDTVEDKLKMMRRIFSEVIIPNCKAANHIAIEIYKGNKERDIPTLSLLTVIHIFDNGVSDSLIDDILKGSNSIVIPIIEDAYYAVRYLSENLNKKTDFNKKEIENVIRKTIILAIKFRIAERFESALSILSYLLVTGNIEINIYLDDIYEGFEGLLLESKDEAIQDEELFHKMHSLRKSCFSFIKLLVDEDVLSDIEVEKFNKLQANVENEFRDVFD
jgi:hypothetical protein